MDEPSTRFSLFFNFSLSLFFAFQNISFQLSISFDMRCMCICFACGFVNEYYVIYEAVRTRKPDVQTIHMHVIIAISLIFLVFIKTKTMLCIAVCYMIISCLLSLISSNEEKEAEKCRKNGI